MMPAVMRATVIAMGCVLSACGGGSGSSENEGAGFPNKASTDQFYSTLADNTYTGAETRSEINEFTALAFADFLLGADEVGAGARQAQASAADSAPDIQITSPRSLARLALKHRPMGTPDKKSAQATGTLPGDTLGNTQYINETVNCDLGGTIKYQGNIDSYGLGLLKIVYNNCVIENAITLTGEGHIAYDSYYSYSIYYNHVKSVESGNTSLLDGYIFFDQSRYDDERILSYITYSNPYNEEQIKLENLEASYNNYNDTVTYFGNLYLSSLGYVSISTSAPIKNEDNDAITFGEVSFTGNGSSAEVEFYSNQYIQIRLDKDADGKFELGTLLSGTDKLTTSNSGITFVALADLNLPPTVNTPYLYSPNYQYDTRVPLSVSDLHTSDPEGDPVSVLEYRWYINGELILITPENEFPPYTAFYGDTVGVQVLVSDGNSEVLSGMATETMRDAPAEFKVSSLPASAKPGQTLTFTVQMLDPDTPDSPTAGILENIPEGMSINSEGVVTWLVPASEVSDVATYRFTVRDAQDAYNKHNLSISVVKDGATLPIARSGIEVPKANYSMHIGHFTSLTENEVLTTDSNQRVMLLKDTNGEYQPSWMYPFALPTGGQIKQVVGFDLNNDNLLDIIVATEKGVSRLSADGSLAEVITTFDNENKIKAIAVGKLDPALGPQLVVLASESSSSSSNTFLRVIDIASGTLRKEFALGASAREVVLGNVDNDDTIEIVVNDGSVYDAVSFVNEWFYSAGFGDLVAVGDVNNDGVDEILAAKNRDEVALFSKVTKTKLWTLNNSSTCSLLVENIDHDAQNEVLIGDCYWGNIEAYDALGNAPVLELQWPATSYGVKSLTVGDADNDNTIEVVWGIDQSSSGADLFVVGETDGSAETRSNNVQLDTFGAAGWVTQDNSEKAVFIIPETNSGYDGQRIALMDAQGNYELSGEISTREGGEFGVVVNQFTQEGDPALFLSTVSGSYDAFKVLDLSDYSEIWSSGTGNYYDNIRSVKAADINQDGHQDAIYIKASKIEVIDIINEVRLASSVTSTDTINDVAIADIDGDTHLDIVFASNSSVQIWLQDGSDFNQSMTLNVVCKHIELVELDADATPELACAKASSYYSSSSAIATYDIGQSVITPLNSFDTGGDVTEIAVDPSRTGMLFVGVKLSTDYYVTTSMLQQRSLTDGKIHWSSPDLIGSIVPGSLFLRTPEEASGGAKMMFATTKVMYLFP